MKNEVSMVAKSLLSGRNGRVYRLYKRVEYKSNGDSDTEYNIRIPRLLFGWKWLKLDGIRMWFRSEEKAREWIESHKNQPKNQLKEIPL
jgi:hypothetical protein